MRLLKFLLRFLGLQYKEPLLQSFIIQLITTLIALEKCEKKKAICLRLLWYKVFDNGKLKLLIWQFPNGFHLKYNEVQLSPSSKLVSYQSWKLLNRLMSRKQYPFFRKIKVFTIFLIILTWFIILWADFFFYVQRWISLGNYRYVG